MAAPKTMRPVSVAEGILLSEATSSSPDLVLTLKPSLSILYNAKPDWRRSERESTPRRLVSPIRLVTRNDSCCRQP